MSRTNVPLSFTPVTIPSNISPRWLLRSTATAGCLWRAFKVAQPHRMPGDESLSIGTLCAGESFPKQFKVGHAHVPGDSRAQVFNLKRTIISVIILLRDLKTECQDKNKL